MTVVDPHKEDDWEVDWIDITIENQTFHCPMKVWLDDNPNTNNLKTKTANCKELSCDTKSWPYVGIVCGNCKVSGLFKYSSWFV